MYLVALSPFRWSVSLTRQSPGAIVPGFLTWPLDFLTMLSCGPRSLKWQQCWARLPIVLAQPHISSAMPRFSIVTHQLINCVLCPSQGPRWHIELQPWAGPSRSLDEEASRFLNYIGTTQVMFQTPIGLGNNVKGTDQPLQEDFAV